MKTQVSLLPKDTNTLCEKICAKSGISFHIEQLAILHQIAKLLFFRKSVNIVVKDFSSK